MTITEYLESALLDLEAFSLPSIGTFRKVYRPASVDEEGDRVMPPSVKVEIDPMPDPSVLMSRYLVRKMDLDIQKAREVQDQIVDVLQKSLEQRGYYLVSGVGSIERMQGGRLIFLPSTKNHQAISEEFFGLRPISLSPQTQDAEAWELDQHPPIPMSQPQPSAVQPTRSGTQWRTLAVLALLLALGYAIQVYMPKSYQRLSLQTGLRMPEIQTDYHLNQFAEAKKKRQAEMEAQSVARGIAESGSIPSNSETGNGSARPATVNTIPPPPKKKVKARPKVTSSAPPADQIAMNDQVEQLPTDGPILPPDLGTPRGGENPANGTANARLKQGPRQYHLIVGSFKNQALARELIRELKKDGYDPIILYPPKGSGLMYRVSIYRNASKPNVEQYAERQKSMGKQTGWIFEEIRTK
ncbi:SPOR domain-containing protein [Pontibacter sp. G13]|uniref:SPOR domain-containing protein n=1 Tax=Pontibacter sp. G13 TaxID=3074898 RepID=UPI00288BE630|nr:SPOR domain-containing protein [Pontibacter sp. G13]WNJ18061.1 SPOR domain-containing protein [Pontibacter sp. G13]